jgi:hypothetical protein
VGGATLNMILSDERKGLRVTLELSPMVDEVVWLRGERGRGHRHWCALTVRANIALTDAAACQPFSLRKLNVRSKFAN